jgi:hypothetical protein
MQKKKKKVSETLKILSNRAYKAFGDIRNLASP